MRVVSNTSPISNLAIIGRLHLLRERYACVVIPSAVRAELLGLTHPAGKAAIEAALRDGWLIEESLPVQRVLPELHSSLDPGEAEAIALAASTATEVPLGGVDVRGNYVWLNLVLRDSFRRQRMSHRIYHLIEMHRTVAVASQCGCKHGP